ncbi:hypothetical protein [Spongorhabdus nitratireducens]
MIGLLYIAATVLIIRAYCIHSFTRPVPHSPAALGLAFAAITFILLIGCGALYRVLDLLDFTGLTVHFTALAFTLACVFGGGYLSARTSEDTQSMNIKILAVVGFLPYMAITAILYSGDPSWLNYLAAALYIPVLACGYFTFTRTAKDDATQHIEKSSEI